MIFIFLTLWGVCQDDLFKMIDSAESLLFKKNETETPLFLYSSSGASSSVFIPNSTFYHEFYLPLDPSLYEHVKEIGMRLVMDLHSRYLLEEITGDNFYKRLRWHRRLFNLGVYSKFFEVMNIDSSIIKIAAESQMIRNAFLSIKELVNTFQKGYQSLSEERKTLYWGTLKTDQSLEILKNGMEFANYQEAADDLYDYLNSDLYSSKEAHFELIRGIYRLSSIMLAYTARNRGETFQRIRNLPDLKNLPLEYMLNLNLVSEGSLTSLMRNQDSFDKYIFNNNLMSILKEVNGELLESERYELAKLLLEYLENDLDTFFFLTVVAGFCQNKEFQELIANHLKLN